MGPRFPAVGANFSISASCSNDGIRNMQQPFEWLAPWWGAAPDLYGNKAGHGYTRLVHVLIPRREWFDYSQDIASCRSPYF